MKQFLSFIIFMSLLCQAADSADKKSCKRRRIQTVEESQEMAPDIITLISSDKKKIYIPENIAFFSPTLKDMLELPYEESKTKEIQFNEFNYDELNLLFEILTSIDKNADAPESLQAKALNDQQIINNNNLTTSLKLAGFFQIPIIKDALALKFIRSSNLDERTIKPEFAAKKYLETGEIVEFFNGVSVQDLIDYGKIPSIITSNKDSNSSYKDQALLDLSHHHINSLYGLHNIPGIESVVTLNLNYNKLTDLPTDIFKGRLRNLKSLSITNNNLYLYKDSFNGLDNLEELNLTRSKLKELPPGCFNGLGKLKDLTLSLNWLNILKNGTFDVLKQLEYLELAATNLQDLENNIFNEQEHLKELNLSENGLENLPNLDQLIHLEYLNLLYNSLTKIESGTLNNLVNLRSLDLGCNKLESLPEDMLNNLDKLEVLEISHNKLTTLPQSILDRIPTLDTFKYKGNNFPDKLKKQIAELLEQSGSKSD